MLTKLIKYMEDKKLISVYVNSDLNNFSLGFIDSMDENFIKLKILSNDGFYLGYEVININSISRIDEDSDYDKKIQFLAQKFKGNYSELELKDNKKDSIILDLLESSRKEKLVISICLVNSIENDIVGIVEKINDNIVTIISLDDYGKVIEKSIIYRKNILNIGCGRKNLQIIQFLRDNGYSEK